jgi:hypothetical protein
LLRRGSKNHPIFLRNSKNTKGALCLIIACLNMLRAEADAIRAAQLATQRELDALLPAVLDRAFREELYALFLPCTPPVLYSECRQERNQR